MFDDAGRLEYCLIIIKQQREQPKRRVPRKNLAVFRMLLVQYPVFERRLVGPQGDQDFLRVAAERVSEELQPHQVPSLILSRSSSSAWLGSFVAKVPVRTSPAGSYVVKTTPLLETK